MHQVTITQNRAGSPAPGAAPQADGAETNSSADELRLKQLAIILTDISMVEKSVTALWVNEISIQLTDSEEEGAPLLGTHSVIRFICSSITNDRPQVFFNPPWHPSYLSALTFPHKSF